MTDQAALVHDPDHSGLWRRVLLPNHDVNGPAWRDALANDRLVGTCRCGGYLRPLKPYRVQATDWYPAECVACGREVSAHGPHPEQKKTRRSA